MSTRGLSVKEIQQRIDTIGWYHEFDFGDGLHAEVKPPDAQSHRVLWAFIADELNKLSRSQPQKPKRLVEFPCIEKVAANDKAGGPVRRADRGTGYLYARA
jgi:hypothetical protein